MNLLKPPGIILRKWAGTESPAVLTLTVSVTADCAIVGITFEAVKGYEATAAMTAYKLATLAAEEVSGLKSGVSCRDSADVRPPESPRQTGQDVFPKGRWTGK